MKDRLLPETARGSFLSFVQRESRARRASDIPPGSVEEWEARKQALRTRLAEAYGQFPAEACDLAPRTLGVLERDGYRIERLVFQSRPGIWVTANAYVPAAKDPVPAVLSVHGHWRWARVDPVPQMRAIGLAKLGYFVLAVDAFGAGERAINPAPGTYHGALLGASTWPVGKPLLGLQVYDNMRAADYLATRPEVDADRLAITGASGGGNQSMNAGAWDERFKAVVPVCSVGTYDAYLGAACCVCEVLPGALGFAEEGEILSLIAPRALLVINATRDSHQFSVGEAAKSVARARPVFELLGADDRLMHLPVDSAHDYNKTMREAMNGWLARWLRGEGDGSPIEEPEFGPEDVDAIRCFPDNDRPAGFTLLPAFVEQQGRQKVHALPRSDHRERWEANALLSRMRLESRIFGGFPRDTPWRVEAGEKAQGQDTLLEQMVIYPEPDMPVPGVLVRALERTGRLPTAILAEPAGKDVAMNSRLLHGLVQAGWQVLAIDLRATGETEHPRDALGPVPDHNSAEWSIWAGRPLLGQWCWDLIRTVDHLVTRDDVDARHIALVGTGAGGLASICAGAIEDRVQAVAAFATLASFVSPDPFQGHRMATFVPFLLDVGDVPHLASLIAPRRLVIVGPVDAQNQRLDLEKTRSAFQPTEDIYKMVGAEDRFQIHADLPEPVLAESLRGG